MNNKIRRSALLAVAASTQGGGFDIDNYLTIVALEDGLTAALSGNTVEYCVNGDGNWKSLSSNTNTESINKGQTLSFRGNLTPASRKGVGRFTISKSCDLTGNCNSLLFGDNAADNNSLSGKNYAFYELFYNCSTIKNVSSNFLPATTLANYCYDYMFYGCTSLTTAPALPATTLAEYCYGCMFYNCSSLTTAPALPATTLAYGCYNCMFAGCSKLIATPALPATTLVTSCYNQMFYNCSSLTTAPALPATTLVRSCYYSMFSDCSKLTTAPELPATTLIDSCYGFMFRNCTSLTTAPTLPATTLVEYCYDNMFVGCSNLKYIKALFTTTPSSTYTGGWVDGVASSGKFVKKFDATWDVTGVSGIPSRWTVVYDFIPQTCINLAILADNVSKGNQSTTIIHYTALCEGVDENGVISQMTLTGDEEVEIGENKTTSTVQKTVSFTYLNKTATTTITQGPWVDVSYTLNLNNQWQKSSTISNPNSSIYDGVYESYSNKGTNNSGASMYIDINGCTNFKLYIRSYAESSFDYVMVSQLDKTLTYSSSYSNTTLVKAHTRGNQKSGTTINDYTLVEFTNIDGGSHRIQIIYRKDSSSHSGDDRGYVLIPRDQ